MPRARVRRATRLSRASRAAGRISDRGDILASDSDEVAVAVAVAVAIAVRMDRSSREGGQRRQIDRAYIEGYGSTNGKG